MTTPEDPENRPQQQPRQEPPQQPQQPYLPPPPPLSESDLSGAPSFARPETVQPREVRLSFWLWIAGAVLLVLSSALVLVQRDEAVEAARRAGTQGLTEEQFQAAVTVSLVFVLVVGLILGALMAFFAFKAKAGRGWARVALTVLGVVVFLYHLLGFSLVGLLIVLVVGAAVVTLYLPASKAYFDAAKRVG
ncbi:hypothetical protein [Saccharothrix deserti]|uniref:hypothetical protein n=1 Tax=Saccharothrix deserti TaxID=2593674 RepID=UPI00131A6EB8|nr:hypothetical protein [Saccharothrix deserti]